MFMLKKTLFTSHPHRICRKRKNNFCIYLNHDVVEDGDKMIYRCFFRISFFLLPFCLVIVGQNRGQVAFHLLDGEVLALGVVVDLVLLDLAHAEVLGVGVREHKRRHRRRRHHGLVLRQADARRGLDVAQLPHCAHLRGIGLRGVAGGGADALVLLAEHGLGVEGLLLGVAPRRAADDGVDFLGEGLGETVGERLGHDGLVVVVVGLVHGAQLLAAEDADGELTEVVLSGALGGDEVGEAHVLVRLLLLGLLAEAVEGRDRRRALLVGVHLDVVTDGVRGHELHDTTGLHELALHDLAEHDLSVVEDAAGLGAVLLVVEDLGVATVGVATADLPHGEEGAPVDAGGELLEGVVVEDRLAHLGGHRRGGRRGPVDGEGGAAGVLEGHVACVLHVGEVVLTHLGVLLVDLVVVVGPVLRQHVVHDDDALGGVEHVDRLGVLRLDLDGSVRLARRGAADEERLRETLAL
eukprot:PhM_4_TR18701/c2_g2_i1/m.7913